MPPQQGTRDRHEQRRMIKDLHDMSGHRVKERSYEKVALRYWWRGQYREVEHCIKTC